MQWIIHLNLRPWLSSQLLIYTSQHPLDLLQCFKITNNVAFTVSDTFKKLYTHWLIIKQCILYCYHPRRRKGCSKWSSFTRANEWVRGRHGIWTRAQLESLDPNPCPALLSPPRSRQGRWMNHPQTQKSSMTLEKDIEHATRK